MKSKFFYLLIFCLFPNILQGQVKESDSLALVALYHSTNGESWTDNTNWLQAGQPVSSWYGIRTRDTVVDHVILDQNNLTGTLPEEIGNLSYLRVLELKMNQISGEIPAAVGNLTAIEVLSLRSNQFTGSIPPEVGNLVHLEHLYLFENQLDGPIPMEIGNLTKLEYLLLQNNQLSGPIPREIGQLTDLLVLRLNYNMLNDSIPTGIGNLSKLKDLHLSNNELIGNIPFEIGNLTQLMSLNLSVNNLDGSIPSEIGNLTNLNWLGIQKNRMEGSIPPEIGNLVQLTYLSLSDNELSGAIPPEIGNLDKLLYLFLRGNQLREIPDQIGNLKNLQGLSLAINNLHGAIPNEIGNLDSLEWLSLEYNQLSGNIPLEMGQLKKLIHLKIFSNQIEGSVPVELGNLTSLETLNLSRNKLEGPIPRELAELPLLSYLNVNFNRFNFYDLEPLVGNTINTFHYQPQAPLLLKTTQINQSTGDELTADISNLTHHPCVASNNQYQWHKDGYYISPYSDSPVLSLSGLDSTSSGGYYCTMINADFPELILGTDTIDLVMDGPVDIMLNSDTIDENIPAGSLVGILTAEDSDQSAGHSYTLSELDGIMDADNEFFTLNQDSLIINISPDFETKKKYQIYITATDNDSKTFCKALLVYIHDIQESNPTHIAAHQTTHITVYPNPVRDYIRIKLGSPECGPVLVELVDVHGRLVQSRLDEAFQTGGIQEIDLPLDPALSPGIYFVNLCFRHLRTCIPVIKK